ncbi:uncharacterized protein LOC130673271 [Microplitis mediator]|uniref:uncharacterized protein LOC130673271 n=1 Tax=Microplitis mediator TaxID=375433 RepID=UPI002556F16B|nr:uncharacterized protein LOC130673271 [Microplitis mediator]
MAIGLDIMAAPFNWSTGKLDLDRAGWMTPGTVHRENIFGRARTDLDDPLKPLFSLPVLQKGIVKFARSDLAKDAGQSVYPYFDSQEVVTDPSFPLGGIGLFKRGTEGFGGFVAPKIYTANIIKDHIQYTVNNMLQQTIYK